MRKRRRRARAANITDFPVKILHRINRTGNTHNTPVGMTVGCAKKHRLRRET